MENMDRTILREQKELKRLYQQNSKPTYHGYFLILTIILIFAHAIDEICSNVNNDLQSSVVNDLLSNYVATHGYDSALSIYSLVTTIFSLFVLLAPFYRSLSDIIGRKAFLVLNIIGMFVGLSFIYWSPNFVIYCIGLSLVNFFILHDMQVVYIFEVAPKKYRAFLYGLTKCIGTLSVLLIPLCRTSSFLMNNDPSRWRMVYLLPMLFAVLVGVILFIFARETKPFMDERIAYLEKPYEIRQQEKNEKNSHKKNEKAGVFHALRYTFQNKETTWIVIAFSVFAFGFMSISNYYESIMNVTYEMSEESVSIALGCFPICYAVVLLIAGVIGDWIGRKALILIYSVLTIISLVMFNVSGHLGLHPILIGIFMSLSRSLFFTAYDYISMMGAEKAPTSNRSSVVGAISLVSNISTGIGYGLIMILLPWVNQIGVACMCVAIPPIIAGSTILMLKVKETKGTDLEKIASIE